MCLWLILDERQRGVGSYSGDLHGSGGLMKDSRHHGKGGHRKTENGRDK